MSSDYISRLRAELLRAGAAEPAPRRRVPRLRPLAAAVAVALLVATAVLILPGERRDERPAQDPVPAVTYRVQAGDATETAQILRERLDAAGISGEVTAGGRTLTITAREDVTALTAPGRLAVYDWERSVLGPDGRPAPNDPAVTGGPDAGQAAALTEAEARSRGGHAVEADRGWFALADDPALTNADVASARAGQDPASGDPIVVLELTSSGQQAFRALTRELAERGAADDPLQSAQHLAFVLDDRLIATPFVNPREAPHGIDGAEGAHLSGLATPEQARLTAALLSAGPLPGTLEPIGG